MQTSQKMNCCFIYQQFRIFKADQRYRTEFGGIENGKTILHNDEERWNEQENEENVNGNKKW